MNKKLFFLNLFIFMCICLYSEILEVNLDGSTPYITIQSAIVAATNSDTVLVHPGTYYENINFNGRSITLGSLFLITQDESFINQTIIDGNQQGKVISIESVDDAKIIGLMIINGKVDNFDSFDSAGGGIFLINSSLLISNCILYDNLSKYGGAVYANNSNIIFASTIIKNNIASLSGGGICSVQSSMSFIEEQRSSIFLNFSSQGSDIFLSNSPEIVNIFADTLTVFNPEKFYCLSISNSIPSDQIIIDQLNAKIDPIDADIYVSPQGDDSNNGLTENTPFKTIHQALIHTKPNSDNPHKINLLSGIYSENSNGEIFPLPLRDFTTITGTNNTTTIIDAESINMHIIDRYSINAKINNITLNNGYQHSLFASIYKWNSLHHIDNKFTMENVIIKNSDGVEGTNKAIYFGDLDIEMNGVEFINNNTRSGSITNFSSNQLSRKISNCTFSNNLGTIGIGNNANATLRDSVQIINSLFYNNYNDNIEWGSNGSALRLSSKSIIDIVNCTFADNIYDQPDNGGALLIRGSIIDVNIYNSIMYNNTPYNTYVVNQNSWAIGLTVDYSLIENGEESISAQNTDLYYGLNNIDTDPLFMGAEALNFYVLSTDSPCIDAGTLDLPEWIELPEFDLAGNPRISGESIDIGCYEYTPFVPPNNLEIDSETGILFWSQPNYEYPSSYNLSLNGEFMENINAEIFQYDFSDNLDQNLEYIAGVSAVYSGGESIISEIQFTYNPVFGGSNEISFIESKITNYPNPFGLNTSSRNVATTIKFILADEGNVKLVIYNIKGQKVKDLMKAYSGCGVFEMQWDGRDNYGVYVSSGTYLVKCELNGGVIATNKMTFIK